MSIRFSSLITLLPLALASTVCADVKLAPVFGDHMVLQREMKVPIWGKAKRSEEISVTFQDQTVETITDSHGDWMVHLEPMPASSEGAELIVTGKNTVTLSDVVVGEVWLCAGQSNMGWTVMEKGVKVNDAEKVVAAADYPLIRQLRVPKSNKKTPSKEFEATWVPCSPETVGAYSGVAYFFARDLFEELDVPIGIITSAYGGTPIEAWLSEETFTTAPAALAARKRLDETIENWDQTVAKYRADTAAWEQEPKDANGKRSRPKPRQPIGPGHPYSPITVYNAMLSPLFPYGIRGAIWYQGEGNTTHAEEYSGLLEALIGQWRREWNQGDFPFYYVQLPNYKGQHPEIPNWALLREQQEKTLRVPNTGMAVTIDVGNANDLHPRNKQDVGKRLALLALDKTYQVPGHHSSGPALDKVDFTGGEATVTFTSSGGLDLRTPNGFELAGSDRVYHPATARLENGKIIVNSPQVAQPTAVRYAWINAPEASLFDQSGLPAPPFRTDDWPIPTSPGAADIP